MKSHLLPEIQLFLTRYGQQERKLSRATILSYRDTLKLFLLFQREHLRRAVARLEIEALSYESVIRFLDYLEKERGASTSTRNQRLAAIRSLCRFILFRHPECSDTVARCLAIPMKKGDKKLRGFLETREVEAILGAVDRRTWLGRRNYLMLDLAIQTGLRVSELTALKPESFTFGKAPYITVKGKGRKERSVPLNKNLARCASRWLSFDLPKAPSSMFPTTRGTQMSNDAVQYVIGKYVKLASVKSPTLRNKKVSPHTLRHTTAMQMLNRGVDVEIIALWLGHEEIDTTKVYFSESLAIKRKALKKTRFNTNIEPPFRPRSDLSFLDDL